MVKGLTGGIASGKTRFENKFKELGYSVFDTDKADFILRTGIINLEKDSEVLICDSLAELVREESKKIIFSLNAELPRLYNKQGTFSRNSLLSYINDDKTGLNNLLIYNQIINPASIKFYQAWYELVKSPTLLSSAALIERGNLSLVDEVYFLKISEEIQLRNLLKRENERKNIISITEAKKAVNRQWSFEEKLNCAERELGKENVHILNNKSNLFVKVPLLFHS